MVREEENSETDPQCRSNYYGDGNFETKTWGGEEIKRKWSFSWVQGGALASMTFGERRLLLRGSGVKEGPGIYATERTSIEEKQCGEIKGPLSSEGMHELEPPYQNWLSAPLAQPTYFLWKKEQPRCARAKDNHSPRSFTQELERTSHQLGVLQWRLQPSRKTCGVSGPWWFQRPPDL